MLVFPGVFGRGRFSELWGFLMICWVSSRWFLGMCPAVLLFWSSLHPSLFVPREQNEKACYANKPTNKWDNFCGRPLRCRAASTRCSAFLGQKSKTNFQVWMEEVMKHIQIYDIWKKNHISLHASTNIFLNFCQTSMHFFRDIMGFEAFCHPFEVHLRRKTTTWFPQNDLSLVRS